MQIHKRTAALVLSLVFTAGAIAQEGLSEQWRGRLLAAPLPTTTGAGRMTVSVATKYADHGRNDPRQRFAEVLLTGTYGLMSRMDVALSVPYGIVRSDVRGLQNASLSAKYQVWSSANAAIALASALHLPTGDEHRYLGSSNWGADIHFAAEIGLGNITLPFSVGVGSNDYIDQDKDEVLKSETLELVAAATYELGKSFSLATEVAYHNYMDRSDDGIVATAGGLWTVWRSLLLKGALGFAITNDANAVPDTRLMVTLDYGIR